MGFFRELLKIVAALVGLPLTLAGLLGALYGFVIVFLAISGEEEDFAMGVVFLLGGIVSLTIGTILGKFARGDYD